MEGIEPTNVINLEAARNRRELGLALGSNLVHMANRGLDEDIHEIAGRQVRLHELDLPTLMLLREQCGLRRDEANFEAAIVDDYIQMAKDREGGDGDPAS